jgi:hypothetical protein
MAEYRAYIIGQDGQFLRAIELVCPDDDTAKEYAKQLVSGHDVELCRAIASRNNAGGLFCSDSV